MRWLRSIWRGVRWVHRHAYALASVGGGLGIFVFTLVQTARGFTGGHGLVGDVAMGAAMALFTAGLIYGSVRSIDWLYAAGVLRGR